MARNRPIGVYLNSKQLEWLNRMSEEGYKKSGLIRYLVAEAMANEAVRENPTELRKQRLKASSAPESNRAESEPKKKGQGAGAAGKSNIAGQSPEKAECHGIRTARATEHAGKASKSGTGESGKAEDEKLQRYADAVEWFIEHPEAMKDDPMLQAFISHIMEKLEGSEAEPAADAKPAEGNADVRKSGTGEPKKGGKKVDSDAETEADKRADAVLWFIENPEALDAMQDRLLKAYILHIKGMVEEIEKEEAIKSEA